MSKQRQIISYIITLLMLSALGVWQIMAGEPSLGAALISSGLAVTIFRVLKNRRIEEQKARGLNPYDERVNYIAGKASSLAISIWVLAIAVFVLAGSTLGPELTVNPYSFAGIAMTLLILINIAAYYYYDRNG